MLHLHNREDRYGFVAKILHWLMAIAMIGLWGVGTWMSDLENSPTKFTVYGLHKAVGITILMLVIVRLAWRFSQPQPALPSNMSFIMRSLAHLGHFSLYGLMILIPLSGWSMSSAAGYPVSYFGLWTLPNLVEANKPLAEFLNETHEILALVMIILVVIHALAACYHQWILKDGLLRRMF
jgi:cytochrome b561